jgi:hypothetical protein
VRREQAVGFFNRQAGGRRRGDVPQDLTQAIFRLYTDKFSSNLAISKHFYGWQCAHAISQSQVGVLIDINSRQAEIAMRFNGQALQHGA